MIGAAIGAGAVLVAGVLEWRREREVRWAQDQRSAYSSLMNHVQSVQEMLLRFADSGKLDEFPADWAEPANLVRLLCDPSVHAASKDINEALFLASEAAHAMHEVGPFDEELIRALVHKLSVEEAQFVAAARAHLGLPPVARKVNPA